MSKFVDPAPKLFRIVRELETSLAVADRVIEDQASRIVTLGDSLFTARDEIARLRAQIKREDGQRRARWGGE